MTEPFIHAIADLRANNFEGYKRLLTNINTVKRLNAVWSNANEQLEIATRSMLFSAKTSDPTPYYSTRAMKDVRDCKIAVQHAAQDLLYYINSFNDTFMHSEL